MKKTRKKETALRRVLALILLTGYLFAFCARAERPQPTFSQQTAENRSATFRVVGDFVIHDAVYNAAKTSNGEYDFSPMLEMIAPVMARADFTFANVDGCLRGLDKYPVSGYPQFNTPPSLLNALKGAGVDALTMANNHSLDWWYDGLKLSIDNAEKAGLLHVGASRSQEEKDTPALFEIGGITFGFLNYTTSLNGIDQLAALDKNALVYGVNASWKANFEEDVQNLRFAGAEFVVCFMHWGAEYRDTPNTQQTSLAKRLCEAGVDVIVGGHPHVVQRADWLTGVNQFGEEQKTLCVYSLGNFLSDQRTFPRDGGIIFEFTVSEDENGSLSVTETGYFSTWVWKTSSGNQRIYRVLNAAECLSARPSGMSASQYQTMKACHERNAKIMESGSAEVPLLLGSDQ